MPEDRGTYHGGKSATKSDAKKRKRNDKSAKKKSKEKKLHKDQHQSKCKKLSGKKRHNNEVNNEERSVVKKRKLMSPKGGHDASPKYRELNDISQMLQNEPNTESSPEVNNKCENINAAKIESDAIRSSCQRKLDFGRKPCSRCGKQIRKKHSTIDSEQKYENNHQSKGSKHDNTQKVTKNKTQTSRKHEQMKQDYESKRSKVEEKKTVLVPNSQPSFGWPQNEEDVALEDCLSRLPLPSQSESVVNVIHIPVKLEYLKRHLNEKTLDVEQFDVNSSFSNETPLSCFQKQHHSTTLKKDDLLGMFDESSINFSGEVPQSVL